VAKFFTCLDLKYAFLCILLAAQSQPIFAFQWKNPNTGEKGQLTWTQVPQIFKKLPTMFGTALASDLKAFQLTRMAAQSSSMYMISCLLDKLRRTYRRDVPSPFSFMGGRIKSL
jgi:hypothetical protein